MKTKFEKYYKSYYRCPKCNHVWDDVWDCACDDSCPNCHENDITPYDFEILEDYDESKDSRMQDNDPSS